MQSVLLPFLSLYNGAGAQAAMRDFEKLGSSLKSFGKSVVGAFGGASLVNSTIGFIRNSADAARDYQQAMAGVNTVYGQYTGQVSQFIQASEKIGMSHADAARNVTFLGSVFKKTGIPMEEVIGKTESLVTLAADLASTYGHDVNEAMTGIAAMFRGEYDPIEKFGVAMKQNQVNALLAARGQANLTGQMQIAAATLARYDLLMANSSDAQGAFARQTNNLFEQQQILKAGFTDMQQTLGEKLVPALIQTMNALQPVIAEMAPKLGGVFDAIGQAIIDLVPLLPKIADGFVLFVNEIKSTYDAFKPLIDLIVFLLSQNLAPLLTFVVLFKNISKAVMLAQAAMKVYTGAVAAATVAEEGMALAAIATPWGAVIAAVALLAAGFVALEGAASDANNAINKIPNNYFGRGSSNYARNIMPGKGMSSTIDEFTAQLKKKDPLQNYLDSLNQNNSKSGQSVKTFFDTLAEDVKKENARVKLSLMGASTGLVDAILSSSTWEDTYKKISTGGATYVATLQNQFNKTKAGLEEIKKAQDEVAKSAEEFQKKLTDSVKKIADFNDSMVSLLKAVSPLPTVTRTMGAFESAVVSSFDAIASSLKSAVDNGLILQESADNLASYARTTQATLQGIAAERDAIAQRISDANDLIASTKQAVIGFGNINSLLETQSQTITETAVSLIDGIRLTLTRSFDMQTTTGDLTANFQKIIDKVKNFATQLKQLKAMGLNQNLFKQIVDAGVDAGGATAAAIIAGGAGTVSELNGLFLDLQTTGADIAETTAQVMYGAGVDVTNGLIAGLMSQSDALAAAAQALADAFSSTFNARMNEAMSAMQYKNMYADWMSQNTAAAQAGSAAAQYNYELLKAYDSGLVDYTALANSGNSTLRTASVGSSTVFNVSVQAGMGTDGASVGEQIINTIKRYERTNGAVWQAAV